MQSLIEFVQWRRRRNAGFSDWAADGPQSLANHVCTQQVAFLCRQFFRLLFLQMRRLAASSILLLILGPFFAPLISAAAPTPVPVCCRRGGAHHCSTMAETSRGGGNAFRATNRCPMRQLQQLGTSVFALPISSSAQIDARLESFIGGAVSQQHFTPVYSIRQRGPPALL